jgi:hypothetical protein
MRRLLEFGPTAAFYLFALAAQVSGYVSPTVALALAIIGTLFLFVPACHHSHVWHKSRKSNGRRGLDSWYFIAPCLVILVLGAAGAAYGFGLRASAAPDSPPTAQPVREQFLKDAVLAAWSDNPKEPLMFLGTPILTTDRLRVLVEYSLYRNGWMSRVRFEVDPIKEPVKGQRVKVPLAHIGGKPNGGAEDLWWGTDPSSANLVINNPVYSSHSVSLTRGRIVIIGTNNKEQNAVYFEIARAPNDASGNIKFMVLQGREVGDWVSDWEKDS